MRTEFQLIDEHIRVHLISLRVGYMAVACLAGLPARADPQDEVAIKATLSATCEAFIDGDGARLLDPFLRSDSTVFFDPTPPRRKGYADLQKEVPEIAQIKKANDGPLVCEYLEIHPIILSQEFAYSRSILHAVLNPKNGARLDMTMRSTGVWQKKDGRWDAIHEHNSFPVDVRTGRAVDLTIGKRTSPAKAQDRH